MLDLISKIVSKTIGFDLAETKPMTPEEFKNWEEENERKRKEWEDTHPEEVEAWKKWEKKYRSKKPYTLSNKEKKIVKELLHMDDEYLNKMNIYIYNDGEICVRTPDVSWGVLAGREWCVNLKEKKVRLTSMS